MHGGKNIYAILNGIVMVYGNHGSLPALCTYNCKIIICEYSIRIWKLQSYYIINVHYILKQGCLWPWKSQGNSMPEISQNFLELVTEKLQNFILAGKKLSEIQNTV